MCLGGGLESCGLFGILCAMLSCRVYSALIAARVILGLACAAEPELAERFRGSNQPEGGLSVTLRLDPARGDTAETVMRQLEHLRALGVGGLLVSLPVADEGVWGLLATTADWCRKNRIELGICDFWLSAEEAAATPRLQTFVWSSRQVDGAALKTNELPLVYGPGEKNQEIARLAVPESAPILPHQVVDLAKGAVPEGGPWRVFWFGHRDREPAMVDIYQDKVVFRHLNQGLVELQNRLKNSYGTAFQWYQCAGVGAGELVWPRDVEEAFLKQGGMSLLRQLPALAGVPVGGEPAASHVRQVLGTVLCEAWRERYAANVRDLVQESGLEAGIAIGEAAVEPDEVAYYFRRPTLQVARSEEQRTRNERAAGAARTLARRFVVGRLATGAVSSTPASLLLPFPFKHEMDGLFGDGVTRILLEMGDEKLSDDKTFVLFRQASRYAQACQLLLQHGEPVADVLVWTRRLPKLLEGYSCDYVSQKMVAAAAVRGGRLRFESERSYGALAVSAEVLADVAAEREVRQLAEKGLRVWLFNSGSPEDEAVVLRAAGGEKPLGKVLEKSEDLGLAPDFVCRSDERGMKVRFVHRRSADRELYFVMNGSPAGGVATCTFRDTGRGTPERWDPLTGEIGAVQEMEKLADGRLTAPLYLGPHESCFIVFDR